MYDLPSLPVDFYPLTFYLRFPATYAKFPYSEWYLLLAVQLPFDHNAPSNVEEFFQTHLYRKIEPTDVLHLVQFQEYKNADSN